MPFARACCRWKTVAWRPSEPGMVHAEFPCNDGPASLVALMAGAAAEQVLFNNVDEVGCRVDMQRVRKNGWSAAAITTAARRCGTTRWIWCARISVRFPSWRPSLLRERRLDGNTLDNIIDACLIEDFEANVSGGAMVMKRDGSCKGLPF